uniref:SFRICE_007669 n=1 Tax=Spodoptera frugiperda TaxID=7108 RepID=A0A2H1WYA0_SPOFR
MRLPEAQLPFPIFPNSDSAGNVTLVFRVSMGGGDCLPSVYALCYSEWDEAAPPATRHSAQLTQRALRRCTGECPCYSPRRAAGAANISSPAAVQRRPNKHLSGINMFCSQSLQSPECRFCVIILCPQL